MLAGHTELTDKFDPFKGYMPFGHALGMFVCPDKRRDIQGNYKETIEVK